MRIRRNASKILGSASLAYAANPSCPSTPAAAAGAEDDGLTVCELNCSPWDLMAMDPNSSICNFLTNLEEEEGEEDEGILGNTVKNEETEPICVISAITSTAGEPTLKETKETEEKRTTKRKRMSKGRGKNTVKTSDSSIVARYCKKSDGKGWHCKRPAQLPSSLCGYHLTQIRAYTSNHRAADSSTAVTDDGKLCGGNRREEATGADSSFYYYYEGFGPSRGKQRGKTVKMKEDRSGKGSSSVLDNGGDDENAVAGDDEYDLDCFDEEDAGDVNRGSTREEIDAGKEEEEVEKKRVVKKRGRKPFKCRSLKSLL